MDEATRKQVLQLIPYNLFVVGVRAGDEINAFTGSWMTQISFKPPMIVIGVNCNNRSHEMIRESGAFTISFLDSTQKEMAKHFFQPHQRVGNRLGNYEYEESVSGCPLLCAALGHLECEVQEIYEPGDHALVVGEIRFASMNGEGTPLDLRETGWRYSG